MQEKGTDGNVLGAFVAAMLYDTVGPALLGSLAWRIGSGSAVVHVILFASGENATFLSVDAPVMKLPDDNLLPLYRRLLELNAELLNAAFAVEGEDVTVRTGRETTDMDASEVAMMIRLVADYADQYDDELVAEFGGMRFTDSAS